MRQIGRETIAQVDACGCEPPAQQSFPGIQARFREQMRMPSSIVATLRMRLRRFNIVVSSAAAPPSCPVTYNASPAAAPERRRASPLGAEPTSTMSARMWPFFPPGDSEVSPPASGTRCISARPCRPAKKCSIQARPSAVVTIGAGRARERKAARGVAPMAARSLKPRARQRWPTRFRRMEVSSKVTALQEVQVRGDEDLQSPRADAGSRNRRQYQARYFSLRRGICGESARSGPARPVTSVASSS